MGRASTGGEAATVVPPVGGEAATVVPPIGGRLVAFDSRVEHEVLPAHARRCRPALAEVRVRTRVPYPYPYAAFVAPSPHPPRHRRRPAHSAAVLQHAWGRVPAHAALLLSTAAAPAHRWQRGARAPAAPLCICEPGALAVAGRAAPPARRARQRLAPGALTLIRGGGPARRYALTAWFYRARPPPQGASHAAPRPGEAAAREAHVRSPARAAAAAAAGPAHAPRCALLEAASAEEAATEEPPEPAAADDPDPCTAAPQARLPAQAAPPHARGPREAAAPAPERPRSRSRAGPSAGAERAGAAARACEEARDGSAGGAAPAGPGARGGAGDWRAGRDARVTHPDRVFVSVAAYRDEEAQWTVADLLRRAARPERVRVGIVWQARARSRAGGPRDTARALPAGGWASLALYALLTQVPFQKTCSACRRCAGRASRTRQCLPARQEAAPVTDGV
jgi:hypothetical protein